MKKPHSKPEFSVIKIDEGNTKFFVASGAPGPAPAQSPGGTLGSMSITTDEEW